jgi:hypothetical protein
MGRGWFKQIFWGFYHLIMQKVFLLRLINVSLGWLNNVRGLILSVPSTYIITTMNEELLAASALSVQSGALLVSINDFINFFAIVQS